MLQRRAFIGRLALLCGGALSGTLQAALAAGAETLRTPRRAFFDANARAQVQALAELIIPATDTPGALAAGVPDFIEMMVAEWYTDTERGIFQQGLAALDAHCRAQTGSAFAGSDAAAQTAALAAAEQASLSYVPPAVSLLSKAQDEHAPFFTKIRELTVIGYYTSEVGAKQELHYNPMPMRYDGDFDFAAGGRQWSS